MLFSYIRRIFRRKNKVIIAIGDIHGKIEKLTDEIIKLDLKNSVSFVHVGDFGIGFDHPIKEHKKLKWLDNVLSSSGSKMYVIRGNHDDPARWSTGSSYVMDNIQFVPDNIIMEINGKVCLFAGGAISVDRLNRNKGVNYWTHEEYKWKRPNIIPKRIDHLFTHDVYHQCSPFRIESPTTLKWLNIDATLRNSLDESQEEMKNLYEFAMSINEDFSWYHGHYHESHTTIRGKQKTYCMSIMELKDVY